MKEFVEFYSETGETVLDPTMGDTTAMTATHNLNRNFIGYDVSEENFNINWQLKNKLEGSSDQKILSGKNSFIKIYKQELRKMIERNWKIKITNLKRL